MSTPCKIIKKGHPLTGLSYNVPSCLYEVIVGSVLDDDDDDDELVIVGGAVNDSATVFKTCRP